MSSAEHLLPRLHEVVQEHPESIAVVVSTVPGDRVSWVATLLGGDELPLTEVALTDASAAEHVLSVVDAHLIVGGRPRTAPWSESMEAGGEVAYRGALVA